MWAPGTPGASNDLLSAVEPERLGRGLEVVPQDLSRLFRSFVAQWKSRPANLMVSVVSFSTNASTNDAVRVMAEEALEQDRWQDEKLAEEFWSESSLGMSDSELFDYHRSLREQVSMASRS